MILIELPDVKKFHSILTLGKCYEVVRVIGNGVVVQPDSGKDQLLLLAARFRESKPQAALI